MTIREGDPLPELTAEQRARLEALEAMPDSEIDTSDIPELTDAQLAEMRRADLYRPVKRQITARIDADVLEWLKAAGPGYQSRLNAILRQAMLEGGQRVGSEAR
jgi:uncharacterized protein (DUF4415 family)